MAMVLMIIDYLPHAKDFEMPNSQVSNDRVPGGFVLCRGRNIFGGILGTFLAVG
jgi:hypothetical protein